MADKFIKYWPLILILLINGSILIAQDSRISLGPWNLKTISGELGLEAIYQQQNNRFNEISDKQNSTYLIGGIKLNTTSYLWRPDIISINLNGEYNPETRNEKYLSIPDRSEVRTLKKLDFRTSIFNDRKINLSTWINLDQNYFNRENLTNVKSDNRQWGALLGVNNKILPFTLRFMSLAWDQYETDTERTFSMNQNSLHSRFNRSFFGTDKHELTYSYDDYKYVYSDQNTILNEVNRIALNNALFFDSMKKYGYRSHISYYDQNGKHSFTKVDASEQLIFHLPKNFDLVNSYNFFRLKDQQQLMHTHRVNSSLRHQLFRSLTSEIFASYSAIGHTIYRQTELRSGAELRYTKNILFGRLTLGYKYYRYHNSVESESGIIEVLNESHILGDLSGNFLEKPYADLASVIITDLTGTIAYQEGFDYLLLSSNDFIEIQRIPGGQILQDQEVLVSYSAIQPGTYSYNANNHSYHASLSVFNRLLDFYYRGGVQDFDRIEASDYLTLNQYTQHVLGGKIYYKALTAGIEYDQYNSSLIPYKRMNYFLNLNFKINEKILLSANATLKDYKLLDTDVDQKYTNLSGRFSYSLSRRSKATVQFGYLSQRGPNIDLDLLTGRIDFMTNYRKMYFKTGVTLYNRSYTNSIFTYNRTFIQIVRKF